MIDGTISATPPAVLPSAQALAWPMVVSGAASRDMEADASGHQRGTLVLPALRAIVDASQALMIHKERRATYG
jgi:hypothetical protein